MWFLKCDCLIQEEYFPCCCWLGIGTVNTCVSEGGVGRDQHGVFFNHPQPHVWNGILHWTHCLWFASLADRALGSACHCSPALGLLHTPPHPTVCCYFMWLLKTELRLSCSAAATQLVSPQSPPPHSSHFTAPPPAWLRGVLLHLTCLGSVSGLRLSGGWDRKVSVLNPTWAT